MRKLPNSCDGCVYEMCGILLASKSKDYKMLRLKNKMKRLIISINFMWMQNITVFASARIEL